MVWFEIKKINLNVPYVLGRKFWHTMNDFDKKLSEKKRPENNESSNIWNELSNRFSSFTFENEFHFLSMFIEFWFSVLRFFFHSFFLTVSFGSQRFKNQSNHIKFN